MMLHPRKSGLALAAIAFFVQPWLIQRSLAQDDICATAMLGDIDVAFACATIQNHQSAVDLAKVELKYGDDATTKQLAEAIVASHEKTITTLRDWLQAQAANQ